MDYHLHFNNKLSTKQTTSIPVFIECVQWVFSLFPTSYSWVHVSALMWEVPSSQLSFGSVCGSWLILAAMIKCLAHNSTHAACLVHVLYLSRFRIETLLSCQRKFARIWLKWVLFKRTKHCVCESTLGVWRTLTSKDVQSLINGSMIWGGWMKSEACDCSNDALYGFVCLSVRNKMSCDTAA